MAFTIIYLKVGRKKETFITSLIEFSSEMVLPHLEGKRFGLRYQSPVQSCSLYLKGSFKNEGTIKNDPWHHLKNCWYPRGENT